MNSGERFVVRRLIWDSEIPYEVFDDKTGASLGRFSTLQAAQRERDWAADTEKVYRAALRRNVR